MIISTFWSYSPRKAPSCISLKILITAEAHAFEQKSSIIASSASSSSHAENKSEAITKSDKSPTSVSLAENKSKQTQKASGNPGWPSKAENPITQTKDMSFSKKGKNPAFYLNI